MADFDGVVIGAGHNGLTLAAYLSRAGLRVAVLERNSRIGGGSSTEERILPGFKLNLHANFFMGLGLCPLLNDLELHRFGFSYIEPPVQQAAVFHDGTAIVVYKDLDKTCASLARFSKQDAETEVVDAAVVRNHGEVLAADLANRRDAILGDAAQPEAAGEDRRAARDVLAGFFRGCVNLFHAPGLPRRAQIGRAHV